MVPSRKALALSGVREDLEDRFVVTVMDEGDTVRIIGSPVIIKDVNNYLCRQGINVP